MFRFVAVLLVAAAFGGALYLGGNAFGTWETPKQERAAMPKLRQPKRHPNPKPHSRPATHTQAVKSVQHAKPSWFVELSAACRRGKRESDSIPEAYTPQEIPRIMERVIRLNVRMNRLTAELVSRSGNAAAASKLRALYAQDEALLRRVQTTAQQGHYERLPALGRSLIRVARAENTLFAHLGVRACTVSADELQL